VKRIVNGGYEAAKKLLSNNRDTLERIAQALLEREVIDANEVKLLMEGKPLPEKLPPLRHRHRPHPARTQGRSPGTAPGSRLHRGENPAKA